MIVWNDESQCIEEDKQMGTNPRKGKISKYVWYEPGEYERLMDALDGNYNDEILNIIHDYKRGDFGK